KHFIDTIKMIAYRAETAMVTILRESLARTDDARSLLREIFTLEADIIPDEEDQTLTFRLHHLTNRLSDKAALHLADYLNKTETIYPGTNMRLVYELVS
ncbi:MAG: putative transposase, partial [Candidatus Anammoxibacter sp.]